MESLRDQYAIVKMCRWLQVSRSGYYKWRSRRESSQAQQRRHLEQALIRNL